MSPTPRPSSRKRVTRFPVSREEILREVGEAFTGSATRDDLLALAERSFVLRSGGCTIGTRS